VEKVEVQTVIPCTPEHFVGVTNLRGEIVPLVDLAIFWGLPPLRDPGWCLILQRGADRLGILASRVLDVLELATTEVHPLTVSLPSKLTGYAQAEVSLDGRPVMILNAQAILDDHAMTVNEQAGG
jgi:purine-binding chemotaxis protein CheW